MILLGSLSGCGAINYHVQSVDNALERIETMRNEYERKFIGKSNEFVLVEFGKPKFVKMNVFYYGRKYREHWVYEIQRTFWEGNIPQAVGFYFDIDKVCVAVSVW